MLEDPCRSRGYRLSSCDHPWSYLDILSMGATLCHSCGCERVGNRREGPPQIRSIFILILERVGINQQFFTRSNLTQHSGYFPGPLSRWCWCRVFPGHLRLIDLVFKKKTDSLRVKSTELKAPEFWGGFGHIDHIFCS